MATGGTALKRQLESQVMATRGKNENDMPDVPDPDFVGALCEIWATINYASAASASVSSNLSSRFARKFRLKRSASCGSLAPVDW